MCIHLCVCIKYSGKKHYLCFKKAREKTTEEGGTICFLKFRPYYQFGLARGIMATFKRKPCN